MGNRPKIWFFEFEEKFGHNKKNYICYIPAQIPYLGKIFCLRYRPKYSKPIRLQKTAWNLMKQPYFWHVDKKKFTKFKSWLKMSYLGMARNGCGQAGLWTLKLYLKNDQMELTDFFARWYKFTQIKRWLKILWVGKVKNRFGQSGHGTLKLIVFEEGTDIINWFFACWYRFTKTATWPNIF